MVQALDGLRVIDGAIVKERAACPWIRFFEAIR
jgi:hypothetical protein